MTFDLTNVPEWWNISGTKSSTIKSVDIKTFGSFNTIDISLSFPSAQAGAQVALSRCHFLNQKLPCPKLLAFRSNINRESLELIHINGGDASPEKIERPFYGLKLDSVAAVPAVPPAAEKRGSIVFRFEDTTMFAKAAEKYVAALADSGTPAK